MAVVARAPSADVVKAVLQSYMYVVCWMTISCGVIVMNKW
jgi:hypothetical protein